jgi:hypothetical protein
MVEDAISNSAQKLNAAFLWFTGGGNPTVCCLGVAGFSMQCASGSTNLLGWLEQGERQFETLERVIAVSCGKGI